MKSQNDRSFAEKLRWLYSFQASWKSSYTNKRIFFRSFLKKGFQHVLERPVTAFNVGLLFLSLIVGYWLYAGKISAGIGDDWVVFSPKVFSSEWRFLSDWYFGLNAGRIGGALLSIIFRLPNYVREFSPEAFPWWLIYSTSLFCTIASPINLGFAVRRITNINRSETIFLLFALCALWTVNGMVYDVTLMAVTVSGRLAIYILTFMLYLLPSYDMVTPKRWKFWALFSVGYLVCSLSFEQLLISLPILFSGVTLLKGIHERKKIYGVLRQIAFWLVLSAISSLIYITCPGLKIKTTALRVSLSPMAIFEAIDRWYGLAVSSGYALLFGDVPYVLLLHNHSLLLHSVLLIVLGLFFVVLWFARYYARRRAMPTLQSLDDLLAVNLAALMFMVAFIASTITLLATPYFPWYATIYPALLLAFGLGYSVLLFFHLADPSTLRLIFITYMGISTKDSNGYQKFAMFAQTVIIMIAVVVTILLVGRALSNVEHVVNNYHRAAWLTDIRRNTYQSVINAHIETGKKFFRLSRCPVEMDSPWGFPQYFNWSGHPDISALIEGQGDSFKTLLERKDWTTIQATVPPLFPWKWPWNERGTLSKPVRTVVYIDGNGSGGEDSDFWVPEKATRCSIIGFYNPNIAGSSAYQETFEYKIMFGTGWAGIPVRLMEPKFVGGLKWTNAKISVNYIYDNKLTKNVPLDSFRNTLPKRPLLRVSISDVGPGWLGVYSKITMECQ
jgi:hypothetical protein